MSHVVANMVHCPAAIVLLMLSILVAQHNTGTVWVTEVAVLVQVICEQHSNRYSWPVICTHPSHGKLSSL
jgi:cell division protein FtsW (lipid II flippase)